MVGIGGAGIGVVRNFLYDTRISEALNSDPNAQINCIVIDTDEKAIKKFLESKILSNYRANNKVTMESYCIKSIKSDDLRSFLKNDLFTHLKNDGVIKYNEGISNCEWLVDNDIINLEGGTGKMRATSKAMYYYDYYKGELRDTLENFFEKVYDQKKPLIVMIVGLGGGTGSGIFIDLAFRLKKEVPDSAIWGFGILPSDIIDTNLCKRNAYSALCELKYVLTDRAEEFSEYYKDPFDIFFLISLTPVSNNLKEETNHSTGSNINELDLRKEYKIMDQALTDLLIDYIGFGHDPEDIIKDANLIFRPVEISAKLGKNARRSNEECFTMLNLVKYVYPINDTKELASKKIALLKNSKNLQGIKDNIMGLIDKKVDDLGKTIEIWIEIMKDLVGRDDLEIKEDKEKVKAIIFDLVKDSIEPIAKEQVSNLKDAIETISIGAGEITPEYKLGQVISDVINKTENLSKNYEDYDKLYKEFDNKKRNSMAVIAGRISPEQKEILENFSELINSINTQLKIIKRTVERSERARASYNYLTPKIQKDYNIRSIYKEIMESIQEDTEETIDLIRSISGENISALKNFDDTQEKIEKRKAAIDNMVVKLNQNLGDIQESIKNAIDEKTRIETDINNNCTSILKNKKTCEKLEKEKRDLEIKIDGFNEENNNLSNILKVYKDIQDIYGKLLSSYTIDSDYHKNLETITDYIDEYNELKQKISTKSENENLFLYKPRVEESEIKNVLQSVIKQSSLSIKNIINEENMLKNLSVCIDRLSEEQNLYVSDKYDTEAIEIQIFTKYYMEMRDIIYNKFDKMIVNKDGITIAPLNSKDEWRTSIYVLAGFAKLSDIYKHYQLSKTYHCFDINQKRISHALLLECRKIVEEDGDPKNLDDFFDKKKDGFEKKKDTQDGVIIKVGEKPVVEYKSGPIANIVPRIEFQDVSATGKVEIKPLSENEVTVKMDMHVFQYLSIEPSASANKSATIYFQVEKTDLQEQNIAKEEVSLYRFHNNQWMELQTGVVSETDEYVKYKATTEGFSEFAIAKKVADTKPNKTKKVDNRQKDTEKSTTGFDLSKILGKK